jgi:hypothetical protein
MVPDKLDRLRVGRKPRTYRRGFDRHEIDLAAYVLTYMTGQSFKRSSVQPIEASRCASILTEPRLPNVLLEELLKRRDF